MKIILILVHYIVSSASYCNIHLFNVFIVDSGIFLDISKKKTYGDIQLLRYHKMTKIWTPLPPCLHFCNPHSANVHKFSSPHLHSPTPHENCKSCLL